MPCDCGATSTQKLVGHSKGKSNDKQLIHHQSCCFLQLKTLNHKTRVCCLQYQSKKEWPLNLLTKSASSATFTQTTWGPLV